jgi:hypothetical protein
MQSEVWYRPMPGTTETVPSDRADGAAAEVDARSPAGASLALSDGVCVRAHGETAGPPVAGLVAAGLVVAGLDRAAAGLGKTDEVVGNAEPADCISTIGLFGVGSRPVVSGEPLLAGLKKGDAEANGSRSCLPGPDGPGGSVTAARRESTSAPAATPPADAAYGRTAAGWPGSGRVAPGWPWAE